MSTIPQNTIYVQTTLETADVMMLAAGLQLKNIPHENRDFSPNGMGRTNEERMMRLAVEIAAVKEFYKEAAENDSLRWGILATHTKGLTKSLVELNKKEFGDGSKVLISGNELWVHSEEKGIEHCI